MIENFTAKWYANYRKDRSVVTGFYVDITQIVRQLQNYESNTFQSIDYIFHPFSRKGCMKTSPGMMLDLNESDISYFLTYNHDSISWTSDRNARENTLYLNL